MRNLGASPNWNVGINVTRTNVIPLGSRNSEAYMNETEGCNEPALLEE
jgi:hypothetical protein